METKKEEKTAPKAPESNGASTAVSAPAASAPPARQELTQSERFATMVMKEFAAQAGKMKLSAFHRKLIQNYFIKLDMSLKEAEKKRYAKSNDLPFEWKNVNTTKMAIESVAFVLLELDPTLPNHLNLIPYKNDKTKKYDIGFIKGYRGLEIVAKKYGLEVPDDVIIELVYSNDHFKQLKRNATNKIESYEFEITNSFDRGKLLGGFYYYIFNSNPSKNRIEVLTIADIEKRKPKYASAEFWGGEKDKWVDGKKDGKEKIEGWYEEMCWKTIARAAYNDITLDAKKIDDNYLKSIEIEQEAIELRVAQDISANANKNEIGIEDAHIIETTSSQLQEPQHSEESNQHDGRPAESLQEDEALSEDAGNEITILLHDAKKLADVEKVENVYKMEYGNNLEFQRMIASAKEKFDKKPADKKKAEEPGKPTF